MRAIVAWVVVGGCLSDQDFYRDPELYVPPQWEDPTMASTVGSAFVVAFPDNFHGNGRVLALNAAHVANVTVTQRAMPEGWALDHAETFSVAAGSSQIRLSRAEWETFDLMEWASNSSDGGKPTGPGAALFVEADGPIELNAVFDPLPAQTDDGVQAMGMGDDLSMTRVLPLEELGTRYQVIAPGPTDRPERDYYYFVVAVDDDTEVVTTPGSGPVHLDRGELTRVALTEEDILADRGWLVTADRPVAVFSGGGPACVESYANGMSSSWEQIPPVARWGTDYLALPIEGVENSEVVVVADVETFVQLDCGDPVWLAPGQLLRWPLDAPTRVSGPRPFLVMVESRRSHCDLWEGGAGWTAVTPSALYRSAGVVDPLADQLQLDPLLFETFGADLTDLVAAAGGPSVQARPPATVVDVAAGSTSSAEYMTYSEPTTLTADRLRGLQYALSPYPGRTGPDAADAYLADWEDVLYVTHLGYDCTDCVPDLTVPATCP